MKILLLFKDLSRILRLLDSHLRFRSFVTGLLLLLESLLELGFLLAIASMTYVFTDSALLRDSFFYKNLFWVMTSREAIKRLRASHGNEK